MRPHQHPTAGPLFEAKVFTPTKTSAKVAEKVRPYIEGLRRDILDFIASRKDGATDWEIWEHIQAMKEHDGVIESTVRARRVDLRDAAYIFDSGQERTNGRGNMMTVWVIVPAPGGDG